MAQSSDIKNSTLTTSSAAWVLAGAVSIITASFVFSGWVDYRIADNIDSYADKNLYPRIRANERGIINNRQNIDSLKKMIESSDASRASYYGNMRKQNEEMIQMLDDIKSMSIRK